MKSVIPLINRSYGKGVQKYLDEFAKLLPEENIVPASSIPIAERTQCDIAIVANPDPNDVAAFTKLKWVHSLNAGVERLISELDMPKLQIVRLVDPTLTDAMAEAVLAWTLYLHREMPSYASQQQRKLWRSLPYIPAHERKVGILGLGELGQASAKRLTANGFNVLGWSRKIKQLSEVSSYSGEQGLQSILEQSQILVCLLPLTKETDSLLDKQTLSRLPKDASIINFSRGAVINTIDLVDQLDKEHLKHAVLDVFDEEPLSKESNLWAHSNITVLPHISGPTQAQSASRIIAQNIRHYRQTGEIPDTVDKLLGY